MAIAMPIGPMGGQSGGFLHGNRAQGLAWGSRPIGPIRPMGAYGGLGQSGGRCHGNGAYGGANWGGVSMATGPRAWHGGSGPWEVLRGQDLG